VLAYFAAYGQQLCETESMSPSIESNASSEISGLLRREDSMRFWRSSSCNKSDFSSPRLVTSKYLEQHGKCHMVIAMVSTLNQLVNSCEQILKPQHSAYTFVKRKFVVNHVGQNVSKWLIVGHNILSGAWRQLLLLARFR